MARGPVLAVSLCVSLTQLVLIPASAALSDRVGRLPVYAAGAAGIALWAVPLFLLVDTGSLLWLAVGTFVASCFLSIMYGPQAALFAELFTPQMRYTGASLGYQIAAVAAWRARPVPHGAAPGGDRHLDGGLRLHHRPLPPRPPLHPESGEEGPRPGRVTPSPTAGGAPAHRRAHPRPYAAAMALDLTAPPAGFLAFWREKHVSTLTTPGRTAPRTSSRSA